MNPIKKGIIFILVFLLFESCADNDYEKTNKPLLIIDTDITMGLPLKDVDDGLAVASLILSDKYNIKGITVTYGNGELEDAYNKSLELLAELRSSIPVYKGSSSKFSLGVTSDASDFIINTIKENPDKVNIIALGPLTNLATVLELSPDIVDNVASVTVMGGAFAVKGNVIPYREAEYNFYKDPVAADMVFKNFNRINLFPLDICMKTVIDEEMITELSQCSTKWCQYLYKNIKDWYDINFQLYGGFYPFDAVAAMYLVDNEIGFKFYSSSVSLITEKNVAYYGKSITNGRREPLHKIYYDMDVKQFKENLWKTLQISVK